MAALTLIIVLIVVVAIFSVQNASPVTIAFLAWQLNASLALVALLFFLTGYRILFKRGRPPTWVGVFLSGVNTGFFASPLVAEAIRGQEDCDKIM